MDIRQLQYFREIVNQGSISKAAESLNIAQPPLSQLLKKMENELGTTLIHRYRKKWELTETGEILFDYANQTLSQMDALKQQILEIEEGSSGKVRIGVSTSCSNILVDFVSKYHANYPNVKIFIITGTSEDILDKLKKDEIDLAVVLRPNHFEQFESKILKEQHATLIVPKLWGNVFSNAFSLETLASYPFILLGAMEGHSFHESLLSYFESNGLKPNIVIESKNIAMVVALVNKGLGISIIPQMDYRSPAMENVAIFKLNELNLSVEPVILKLKDRHISKAANQFWELVNS
ncbi:LysR family transcriptional regulator [Lysinibacillus yapensis]|uniref:LysR family transcriptional regulator n=1 Tax=Ureibacillus yapensis TaxID=2304605 RepID=A0A396SBG1_9BACL|nr:LysR family transcriptional regulator [Lysinibacillus yapensis]RHW38370.1 LysR family transcriptional regulator [Lysinibacillus yapensis]